MTVYSLESISEPAWSGPDHAQQIMRAELLAQTRMSFAALPNRQKAEISARFGLDASWYPKPKWQEIRPVSRERKRQHVVAGLGRLRDALAPSEKDSL